MDALTGLANQGGQHALDPGVQVLRVGRGVRLIQMIRRDLLESAQDVRVLVAGEQTGGEQCGRVGPLELEFMRQKKPVLLQAPVEPAEGRMEFLRLFPECLHVPLRESLDH